MRPSELTDYDDGHNAGYTDALRGWRTACWTEDLPHFRWAYLSAFGRGYRRGQLAGFRAAERGEE